MVCGQGNRPLHQISLAPEVAQARYWYLPDTSITTPVQSLLLKFYRCILITVIAQRTCPILTQLSRPFPSSLLQQKLDEISHLRLGGWRQFFDEFFDQLQLFTHVTVQKSASLRRKFTASLKDFEIRSADVEIFSRVPRWSRSAPRVEPCSFRVGRCGNAYPSSRH